MREILPGVHHWTAHNPNIGATVSSYYVEPAGLLVDPMVPEDGLDAFAGLGRPQQIVLTTGHHHRHAQQLADAFGIPIRVSREGADRLGDRLETQVHGEHEELAPGVHAVHIGVLCPDEYALHIDVGGGALAFADALVHYAP